MVTKCERCEGAYTVQPLTRREQRKARQGQSVRLLCGECRHFLTLKPVEDETVNEKERYGLSYARTLYQR